MREAAVGMQSVLRIHVNEPEADTLVKGRPTLELDSPVVAAVSDTGGSECGDFLLPSHGRWVRAMAV